MVKETMDAVSSVSVLIKKVLDRLWGDQTSAQARIEKETQQAEHDFDQALQRGDLPAANAAIERLRNLRDQAAARVSTR